MSDASTVVTTVVRRRVRPDRREDDEAWLRRLLAEAEHLDGFLGADVHPPAPGSPEVEYTSVFRFGSLDQLRAFERSELRRRAMEEVVDLVEADAVWDTHTGLELWFDPPPGTVVPQPVRWRMALLLGVVVLVLVFGAAAAAVIGGWPFPLRLALVIAVEITLTTYVLLPWLTRRLRAWIYPVSTTT